MKFSAQEYSSESHNREFCDRTQICAFILVLTASSTRASDDDAEKIEYLLAYVRSSECVFIRNGNEHTPEDAEKHLRMKYERGKKRVTSAETFINLIATKSSFSGKPYRIRCGEQEPQLTTDWLRERLSGYPGTIRDQSEESS